VRRLVVLALLAGCGAEAPPPAPSAAAPAYADLIARHRAELGPGLESPTDPGEPDAETQELVEAVLGALGSGDSDIRALALEDARALPPAGVAALVRVLHDAEEAPELRASVAEALGALATPVALDALVTAIEKAPEPWLRAQCGYRLGQTGRDEVLPRLALRLKYEKDYATAFWMADALARFGHLAGVEGMLAVWTDTDDETLRAQSEARLSELVGERGCADAAELLRRWQADELPPAATPFTPSDALRAEAWRWIGNLGAWNLRNVDDARFVLVRLEDWLVPLLGEALGDSDVYVRQHVLQVLERRAARGRGALAAVLGVLDDPRLAPAACPTLGALGDPAAAERLEAALASPDPDLAVAAARALGKLAAPRSQAALKATFEGARAQDLRQATAAAWLALADEAAPRAYLVACLTDASADAGDAELALGSWIARTSGTEAHRTTLLERWNALEPAASAIPTADELARRRAARAELLHAAR